MRNLLMITGFFIAAYTGIALIVLIVMRISRRGIFNKEVNLYE